MTHAFFKALLFLAAGSVIIALHHEQDIRKMGGIEEVHADYLLDVADRFAGADRFPGSRRLLLERPADRGRQGIALARSRVLVYWIAYLSVLLGVFVTALYSFRMFFLVFHGEARMDKETASHLHETPWVVTVPLILLAIPSAVIGWFTVEPCCSAAFRRRDRRAHGTTCWRARRRTFWHGRCGTRARTRSDAGVLAGRSRCVDGVVPVSEAPGHSPKRSRPRCRASTTARSQVLHG